MHASARAPALAERVKGQCQAPSLMLLHLVRQGSSLKLELAESARLTGQRVPRTQSLCLPAGNCSRARRAAGTELPPLNKSHLELVPYVASTYICVTLNVREFIHTPAEQWAPFLTLDKNIE